LLTMVTCRCPSLRSFLSIIIIVVVVVCSHHYIMDPQQAQAQLQQQHTQLQQQSQQLRNAQLENEQMRQRISQLEREVAAASKTGAHAAERQQEQQQSVALRSILPSSSIKAMAPSSFNGSVGVNPEQWLQEMERYLRVTGVDDKCWHWPSAM